MTENDYLDLMNGELDGVNTGRDSNRLRGYLASNDEARDYFEKLEEVCRAVDADPEHKPPPDLFDKILASIPFGRFPTARSNGRSSRWGPSGFFSRRLRYAGAFAAGIIIGVIVYAAVGYDGRAGDSFDNSSMYGTMSSVESIDEFEQVQAAGIDLHELSGQVRVYESEHTLLAEVSLRSPGEVEWVLQFDNNDLSFEGFRRLDGQGCDVAAAPSETRVHQNGDSKYILFFSIKERPTSPITFKVYSADQKLLFEKLLTSAASE